jgi:AcrR family transcriptional regulator
MARTPKIVEDRREQIIDAAMRVFSQKGFMRATNKDIAREAGITPGLIYYYFQSKEALLMAILEARSPVHIMATLPQDVFELPPEFFLRMIIQRVLAVVEGEQFVQMLRMLFPEVIHNPEMGAIPAEFILRIIGFLGKYLEAQVEKGRLRSVDIPLTTQVLLGSLMGFVLRRQIIRDNAALAYSHTQIADAIVDTVLNGLVPR